MKHLLKCFTTISILLSFSVTTFSQVSTKNLSEKLKAADISTDLQKSGKMAEQVDLNNLISLNKSGDVALSIPIVTVKSRTMSFPVQVNYQAGIGVDQKASEVGLGWSINFGSIVRDYGAFEPDYASTSAEVDMQNTQAGYGQGNLTHQSMTNIALPFSNYKNLVYLGIQSGNLTPDNYHVNIPGQSSNTFWNNGANGGQHAFVFSDFVPWQINFDKKTYAIDQEFSRINEVNLAYNAVTKVLGNNNSNLAAAICIPPYVKNRYFERAAPPSSYPGLNTLAIVGANIPNDRKVRYEDFGSFTITADDGTQYVFGRALRGQKYLFSEDPFWSTIPGITGINATAVYGDWWKIDYIAEWLLTEIHSPDYMDINSNNIADEEDAGDWIRVEYTEPEQMEKIPAMSNGIIAVPKHREWQNLTQTDKYSSLMRERAYVTKIVTPVQEAVFSISQRYDVEHDYFKTPLNWINTLDYIYATAVIGSPPVSLEIKYPIETMKYDKVVLKERMNNSPLNTVVFNYAAKGSPQELAVSNYIIRNNQDLETIPYNPAHAGSGFDVEDYNINASNYNAGRGKTTLLGIDFFPQDNINIAGRKSYKFNYGYNPSFSPIHKHQIHKAQQFPTLRQSLVKVQRGRLNVFPLSLVPYTMHEYDDKGNVTVINNPLALEDEIGNFLDQNAPNKGRHAWSLSSITIPTGGTLELEYENDRFDNQGDRQNMFNRGSIFENSLPSVNRYNTIATIQSVLQSKLNDYYASINQWCSNNPILLTRTFELPMNDQSGGLRLKKKTIHDGINAPVVVNYGYGTGHYSSVPASYWNNYLSAFSSFMMEEEKRHSFQAYETSLANNPVWDDNDFATYLSRLSLNIRVDNTVGDNHYYSNIDETYADGSKTRFIYGDPLSTSAGTLYYDLQKVVYLKGFGSNDENQLCVMITNDVDKKHDIKLLKTENYSSNNTIISSTEKEYSFQDLSSKQVHYNALNVPSNKYALYMYQPPCQINYIFPTTPISFIANTAINYVDPFTFTPAGPDFLSIANSTITYVNLYNTTSISASFDHSYNILPQAFTRHQSIFTKLDSEISDYRGIITKNEYTYEPTYGLLKTIKSTNSTKTISTSGSVFLKPEIKITEHIYAYEVYSGLPNPFNRQFLNKNMLSQKAGTNVYAFDNNLVTYNLSTILQSTVQTWSLSYNPKPHKTFVFNGAIDSEGKIIGYSSFNYLPTAVNDARWQWQNSILNFNKFGQPTLQNQNEIFSRKVLGYNSEIPKASIEYTGGWFDATYTGFEDLYDFNKQISTPGGIILVRNYLVDASLNLVYPIPCTNTAKHSYYVDNTSNIFKVGDEVIITANPNVIQTTCTQCFLPGTFIYTNLSPFKTKIKSVTAALVAPGPYTTETCRWNCFGIPSPSTYFTNHKTILCFDDPFPTNMYVSGASVEVLGKTPYLPLERDMEEYWYNTNMDNKSKVVNSFRTGTKSFYLSPKASATDPNQKTPIRPVFIESSNCSGTACNMPYIASCWITGAPSSIDRVGAIAAKSIINFKYEIWDEARTTILAQGNLLLSGINNYWQYFEIEIPVNKGPSAKWLDVYLENSSTSAQAPKESLYIDDLLIFPKGSKYQYNSFDAFLNPTYSTDANDRTARMMYDNWGRLFRAYDADAQLVSEYTYFTTNDIQTKHNYVQVKNWIDGTKYNISRQYFDGIGKLKQTCNFEPTFNRKLINTIDYDNQGRPIKRYNQFGASCN